jgi:hypothetical protein
MASGPSSNIRSAASLLVVLLLFMSVATSSFSLLTIFKEIREYVLTKKANQPFRADIQIPLEEREKEEREEVNMFFTAFNNDTEFVFHPPVKSYCWYPIADYTSDLRKGRIYLVNRTLLI